MAPSQSPSGRFLQWKAVLRTGGKLGSVGVNYLPVNAAPEIDDLVVAPGARLNPQNSRSTARRPSTSVSLPPISHSASPSTPVPANTPLPAVKDRTAVTVRWAAHDENGDDLIYSLFFAAMAKTIGSF